jgi:hypothetical protein
MVFIKNIPRLSRHGQEKWQTTHELKICHDHNAVSLPEDRQIWGLQSILAFCLGLRLRSYEGQATGVIFGWCLFGRRREARSNEKGIYRNQHIVGGVNLQRLCGFRARQRLQTI